MKNKTIICVILIVVIVIFSSCSVVVYDKMMYPLKYEDVIIANASQNNLKSALVASVINVESSFRTGVVSSKGAVGLMQIKPTTAKWLLETKMNVEYDKNVSIDELLKDPEFNIKIGCFYIRYLKNKFEDTNTALFAYNAGEGNVSAWLKDKRYSSDGKSLVSCPFSETNNYVKKVNTNLKAYSQKI